MNTAYERLTDRLRELQKVVKTNGRPNQAKAQCPAHPDRDPSLAITKVDGKVLVHCHVEPLSGSGAVAITWVEWSQFTGRHGPDSLRLAVLL